MAITIYKNMYHVGWDTTGVGVVRSTGGGAGVPTDLSNYYTIEQLVGPGLSIVDFANIANAYHNNMLGLQGGLEYSDSAPPDSDDSSGVPDVISEYYHLDFVNYTRIINQNFIDSLVEESDSIVHLDGDVFDPGINYYYGTDGTGTKGWYNLSEAFIDSSNAPTSDSLWEEDSIGDLSPIVSGAGIYVDGIFIKNSTIDAQDGHLKHLMITAGDAVGATNDAGNLILKAGDAINADTGSLPGNIYLVPGNGESYTFAGFIYLGDADYSDIKVTLIPEGSNVDIGLHLFQKGSGNIEIGNLSTNIAYIYGNSINLTSDISYLGIGVSGFAVLAGLPGVFNTGTAYNLEIKGGDGTNSGDTYGGSLYIHGGAGYGAGSAGLVYIGSIYGGTLPVKTAEVNVVYYDEITGLLSYGAGGGGESLWIELSDGYLSPVGNQGVIISDGDGSMQITPTGWVTFSADARFRKSIQIPISALAIGDSSPDIYWFSTITFGYAYTIADNSAFSFVTPLDYSLDTDIYIRVYWCVNDALVTDQQVQWVGSFTCCPVDGSEQIDDTTGGSTYSGDIPIPVLARSVVYTDLQIPLNYIAPGDLINVELWRETVSGSDPSAEPVILNVVVWYVADRLGDPL